ncbi:MAG: GTP-binding protein [Candidatus Hermodarchaeota archaeon]
MIEKDESIHQALTKLRTDRIKIVVCGEGGVGKTSLLETFFARSYCSSSMTPGFQPFSMNILESITLQIWDLGGQTHFQQMGNGKVFNEFMTEASLVLLCFSLDDLNTLEEIPKWVSRISDPQEVILILVGTKEDISKFSGIENVEKVVQPYLKKFNIYSFIPTSSKTNQASVDNVFIEILSLLLKIDREKASMIIQDYFKKRIKHTQLPK